MPARNYISVMCYLVLTWYAANALRYFNISTAVIVKYDLSHVNFIVSLIYWWSYFRIWVISYCVGLVRLVERIVRSYSVNWIVLSIMKIVEAGVDYNCELLRYVSVILLLLLLVWLLLWWLCPSIILCIIALTSIKNRSYLSTKSLNKLS